MMMRRLFLTCAVAWLSCSPVSFADEPKYIGPNDGPGGTRAWTPQPLEPRQPPSKPTTELYPGYLRAMAVSECMESVMPTSGMSPVDIAASSVTYTPEKAAAIASCVKNRGFEPDPVPYEQASTQDIQAAVDDANSNYMDERRDRGLAARAFISKAGLTGIFPAEGTVPAQPAQAAAQPVKAMATPAVQPVSAPSQPPPALLAPAAIAPAPVAAPVKGQGVFVPSSGDGPSPIFLQ